MKEHPRRSMKGRAWGWWAAMAVLALGPAAHAAPSAAAGVARGRAPFEGSVGQQPAPAPVVVDAEVSVIHATNDADGGIDPNIGKLPNLGNYKSYRLLQRTRVSIRKPATPTTTTLPNQRVLAISLKDVKDNQFIIDTSINQPGGTAFLPLLEVRATVNVPVFIAGQSYQGGMLIIGIKILPR
jgi:hypothetical protein